MIPLTHRQIFDLTALVPPPSCPSSRRSAPPSSATRRFLSEVCTCNAFLPLGEREVDNPMTVEDLLGVFVHPRALLTISRPESGRFLGVPQRLIEVGQPQ